MVGESFIAEHAAEIPLADGGRILVRPIAPQDKDALVRGFDRLSDESRRFRFFQSRDSITDDELVHLTEIDYVDHFAWVAIDLDEGERSGVGVARYIRDEDEPEVAEPAVTVVDDHQGRGIGGILTLLLAESAVSNGVKRFRAVVLGDNLEVLSGLDALAALSPDGAGVMTVEVELPLDVALFRSSAMYELLRRVAGGSVVPHPLAWQDAPGAGPGPNEGDQ